MGMFDGFQGQNIQLTPKIAIAAAMVYVAAGDGDLDPNEKGDIFKVIPDDNVLNTAITYTKRVGFQQFVQQCAQMLSPQQKFCMVLNCADMAMGDGHLGPQEQQMLNQMSQAFQIPEQHLTPCVQTLMMKNNLSVFG